METVSEECTRDRSEGPSFSKQKKGQASRTHKTVLSGIHKASCALNQANKLTLISVATFSVSSKAFKVHRSVNQRRQSWSQVSGGRANFNRLLTPRITISATLRSRMWYIVHIEIIFRCIWLCFQQQELKFD